MMEKNFTEKNSSPTFLQKWRGFVEFLHRPKTKFDIKDRGKGLLLFVLVCWVLMHLVAKITR